ISKFLSQPVFGLDLPFGNEESFERKSDLSVNFSSFSCTYEGTQEILSNLNFRVEPRESLAIVGPVGAGKSTLLLAILNEIKNTKGRIQFLRGTKECVRPKIAFVPQEAYIINDSLRENIIFGSIHSARLHEATTAACLEKDIVGLPQGLETEIGERGVNLSGGQKQRVSLARAYLQNPELVLLDDPLSAVDVKTESVLVERLLFGAWKNHLRIVVTHRLESLARFDRVLFLKDGRIQGCAPLNELIKTNEDFRAFYISHELTQGERHPTDLDEKAVTAKALKKEEGSGRVTEDEDRELGAVKGSVYFDYIKFLGGQNSKTRPWILGWISVFVLACVVFPLLQKGWLAYTSNIQTGKAHENQSWLMALFDSMGMYDWAASPFVSVLWYGVFGMFTFLAILLSDLMWLERGILAGKTMHEQMLKSVLAAPTRFFDSTPVGRILQRFSRDVESVDIHLTFTMENTISCFFHVMMTLVLIVTVLPITAVLIGPLMILYYVVQKDYRISAREAKRLDSIARSPRYAHFKETLQGLTVIRAFSKQRWFMEQFYQKLYHGQKMFYGHYMLNRWFSSRVPLIGGIVAITTTLCIVFFAYHGKITAGMAGLLTVYSLSFWGYLNWGIRIFAELEARLTSVERIKFFSNLESEKSVYSQPEIQTPASWPDRGEIVFDKVQARYAKHLPLVLKEISFRVPAGARVGFVGRTGAGKSTLFQALYRFIEIESGTISLDGIDLSSVPLEKARKCLAIIPQDPLLFMGTIVSNLDRYNDYSEKEIWDALEKAGLLYFVKSLPGGLQAKITENGHNLSQGQRQLLCLARALLVNAKVIVLDEATASVDVQTDALLQKVIRESCKGITLLIIAHRLGTVADCDMIVEIDDGRSRILEKDAIVSVESVT
ncbi:MAG: ATP-binding cassette domain-containing protein, partial [Pseudobdellovibrionaceae bacterium]